MPFLAAAKQMDGLKPEPQGKMAVLENGPDADGKGPPAGVVFPKTNPGRLALKASDLGGFLIGETGVGKDRFCHGLTPVAKILDIAVKHRPAFFHNQSKDAPPGPPTAPPLARIGYSPCRQKGANPFGINELW